MPIAASVHVRPDDRRVAWIDDTKSKLFEVALDQIAHGWSPEETHIQHPYLSLGQIHAVLGYDFEDQAAMDAEI